MKKLDSDIRMLDLSVRRDQGILMNEIIELAKKYGYEDVETALDVPWGARVRFDGSKADEFVRSFFPELGSGYVRSNQGAVELSPKFLLVKPGSRLSWQRHQRRAERWAFLTEGSYHISDDPGNQGDIIHVTAGQVVQFNNYQCHRLVGAEGDKYTLVAEIWQHTDINNLSDEADIERLEDDYNR